MEKLFAGRGAGVSLAHLRSLNDTGDIIKVSYNSKVDENSLEIIKTLNCSDSDDIVLKSVQMDCEGNMLTCKYEDVTWIRDKKVQLWIIGPLKTCNSISGSTNWLLLSTNSKCCVVSRRYLVFSI